MASLEDQPTEVLVQLAEKLKDRRNKLYPQEALITDHSYDRDQDLFANKEEASGIVSEE